jgi:hypothetical protein
VHFDAKNSVKIHYLVGAEVMNKVKIKQSARKKIDARK